MTPAEVTLRIVVDESAKYTLSELSTARGKGVVPLVIFPRRPGAAESPIHKVVAAAPIFVLKVSVVPEMAVTKVPPKFAPLATKAGVPKASGELTVCAFSVTVELLTVGLLIVYFAWPKYMVVVPAVTPVPLGVEQLPLTVIVQDVPLHEQTVELYGIVEAYIGIPAYQFGAKGRPVIEALLAVVVTDIWE